jgi:hypothetical protein
MRFNAIKLSKVNYFVFLVHISENDPKKALEKLALNNY